MTMAEAGNGVLVVGTGPAGAVAAGTLRRQGYAGPLTVVGDESSPPYNRTALNKALLQASSVSTTDDASASISSS